MVKIRIGCCGFPVSKQRYFKEFDIVEIQKTFYEMPDKNLLIKWRKEAPFDFEFVIKVSQLITHPATSPTYKKLNIKIPKTKLKNHGYFKPTDEVFAVWDKTKEYLKILNSKIAVFQCPKSFLPSDENIKNIKKFFRAIGKDGHTLVWEPRGENWKDEIVKEVCRELGLVHCVDPFERKGIFGKINYFRLHGRFGSYNYRYVKEDLIKLRDFCEGKETFCMFNNVYMFEDAVVFKGFL